MYSGDEAVCRETSDVSGKNGSNLLCLLLCFPRECLSRQRAEHGILGSVAE